MLKGENMGFENVRSCKELRNCDELRNCNVNFTYAGFSGDITFVYRRIDRNNIMLNYVIECIRNINSFCMIYYDRSEGGVRPVYNTRRVDKVVVTILRRLYNQLNVVFGYSILSDDAYDKTFGQRVALERLTLSILKEKVRIRKQDSIKESITKED